MKNTLTILFSILILSNLQSQSVIEYGTSTTIDVGTGADVCANYINVYGTYSGVGTFCTGPLPVSISSFTHNVKRNNVTLIWVTEWELNNSGFDVERKEVKDGSEWAKISFIEGNGTTKDPKIYTFEDKKLKKGLYNYRIKQIDYNGNFEYFQLSEDVKINPPNEFTMNQNYPNPSNPKSKIDYELPVNGKVTIKLYNLIGQEVINIVNEAKEAGYYTAEFDGTNLASGVYFYRIIADGEGQNFSKTLKMVIVK